MGGIPSKPDFERFDQPLVVGAGYSRTGTNSMQLALEKVLNGPCLHGGTGLLSGDDAYGREWCQSMKDMRCGNRENAEKLVLKNCKGYAGLTDMPPAALLPVLLDLYPNLKVVLVVRDSQEWWKSFERLHKLSFAWYVPVLCSIIPGFRWVPVFLKEWKYLADDLMLASGGRPEEYGPELVEQYNAWVRSVVPKDRMLEMRLSDGWEPLCKFLGTPIPTSPFPHMNNQESMEATSRKVVTKLSLTWAVLLGVGAIAVWYMFAYRACWSTAADINPGKT